MARRRAVVITPVEGGCQASSESFFSRWGSGIGNPETSRNIGVLHLAHAPPLGTEERAIDRTWGDAHAGSHELARLARELRIPFGAFTHVEESAMRATDLVGAHAVPQGEWSDALFLNVGRTDAVRHRRPGGTLASSQAAILEIDATMRRARWPALV